MSFLEYVKDKRYFVMLCAVMLSFISLLMIVGGGDLRAAVGHVIYANAGCLFFIALYIGIGYAHRRSVYAELKRLAQSGSEEIAVGLPEPQTAAQRILFALIRQMHRARDEQLQRLIDERTEHRDFIMSWIHEVKLPIAACRLLIGNSAGKSAEELADKFEDELGKIDDCVEKALYYSRIDSFSNDYLIEDADLNRLVRGSVKKYAKLFIERGIRFEATEANAVVLTDSKWLSFIIDQLMANSLKYTPEGGVISVRFEEDLHEVRLVLRDSGIGIKREEQRRIFDNGFTGSNGRTHAKATGMGLYLSRRLGAKLGHSLSVRSEEGVFTEMTIHFPKNSMLPRLSGLLL